MGIRGGAHARPSALPVSVGARRAVDGPSVRVAARPLAERAKQGPLWRIPSRRNRCSPVLPTVIEMACASDN